MLGHPHFLWKDLFRRNAAGADSIVHRLQDTVLFKTLSRRELAYLSTLIHERVYQPEEPVFHQNDRGLGMYLIAKGRVAIRTHTPEGEVLVTTLHEGSFFGELALVDPENLRTATAVAMERTVLLGFFKPDLMEILERKPDMGVKILFQLSSVLGHRLMKTTDKITLMTRARGVTQSHEEVL